MLQLGHVVEPTSPLSVFGKNPVIYKGSKYENILAVIYCEGMLAILPDGVQYKNSSSKCRSHIQAFNKKDEIVIWFKDIGIDILSELVNAPLYKQKKQQMSLDNVGQLTYLFSRRKQLDVILEPFIGAIKVEAGGVPFFTLMISGWNAAYQVQQ